MMLKINRGRDFLTAFLDKYWFAPPVALWRSIEARALTTIDFPSPMLDFGCGDGMFTELVFGAQPGVFGNDIARAELPMARDNKRMYANGVQFADGHALPYATGSFGSVYSNSVVEHIPDPERVLPELSRVLRKDGLLVLTVPSDKFRGLLDGVRTAASPALGEAYATRVDKLLAHHHYHSPDEWCALFETVGLSLEKAMYYVSPDAAAAWDRMNNTYGIGQRSLWNVLVSARLRPLGYQGIVARRTQKQMSRSLRRLYDADCTTEGAALLIVGKKL